MYLYSRYLGLKYTIWVHGALGLQDSIRDLQGLGVQGLGFGFRLQGFRGLGSGIWGLGSIGVVWVSGFGVLGVWGFGV